MRVTLSQLETFCWIARLGSFQAAASRLNLAQPTVSLRIRDLEAALGTVLLKRTGRKLQLTAEGSALLEDAESMLALAEHIEGKRRDRLSVRGTVRLGAPESFALACLPSLLSRLAANHPDLRIESVIAPSSDLMRLLIDHELDVSLATNPPRRRDLHVEPLGRQEMRWVAGVGLDLPDTVHPADLVDCQIICNRQISPLSDITLSWFRQAGLEPARVDVCNNLRVIARLAAAGHGISILPPSVAAAELAAGELRLLSAAPRLPRATMCAVYHVQIRSPALGPTIEAAKFVAIETKFLERM